MIMRAIMKCSTDQFKMNLKEELNKLGYSQHMITIFNDKDSEDTYIYLHLDSRSYTDFSFFPHMLFNEEEIVNLGKFNAELLLAIAAMSKEELGIEGEYWKYIHSTDEGFTNDKLYKASGNLNQKKVFIDDNGDKNGFNKIKNNQNTKFFVKATLEEIIEHFKGKEVTPEIMAKKLKAIQELLQ